MSEYKPEFTARNVISIVSSVLPDLEKLSLEDRVMAHNEIRKMLHSISPFKGEPVDFVEWVKSEEVEAHDYNPNSVAPPEMELLRLSIMEDGYTQPIVTNPEESKRIVVDGFHRNRVGKECADVRSRVHGYLPVVSINEGRSDRGNRIASTIRHNRARGKHKVEAMSDIVIELKRRNWSDEKIGRELGMDPDEVLRLCQITGLAEVFKDQEFTEAWEVDTTEAAEELSDIIEGYEPSNKDRILHTYEKWECFKAGFYEESPPTMTQEDGEAAYRDFLSDSEKFETALTVVTETWKHSCEHYLTNDRMNRIAWLGQASVACAMAIPSCCRGGYHLLSAEQKNAADELALKYLNKWLVANGRAEVDMKAANGRTEAELY